MSSVPGGNSRNAWVWINVDATFGCIGPKELEHGPTKPAIVA
jgi:hypothetical protein